MRPPPAASATAQLFLGLALSTLATACVDRVGCALHSDCGNYMVCSAEHQCVAPSKSECRSDADCPGESCTRRGCAPGPICETKADCAERDVCSWHECRLACTEDSACAEGELCLEGACTAACNAGGLCAQEEICLAAQCLPALSSERRFRVAERGSVEITPPSGAEFTAAGSSRLEGLELSGGVLTFTSTACRADAALIESPARVGGAEEMVQSLIEVYDPGAPQAPILLLSDLPEQDVVQLAFAIPPENPSGGCATRDFRISWSDGEENSEEETRDLHLKLPVGTSVVERLPVTAGRRVYVTIAAIDEAGAQTEGRADIAIVRPEVLNFSLSQTHGTPDENVQLEYAVERASRVQVLRDEDVISESLTGTLTVPVGIHSSVFSLRAWDELGNMHVYPKTIQLKSDVTLHDGSEAPEAGEIIGGVAYDPYTHVWELQMPYDGGHFEIKVLPIEGKCPNVGISIRDVDNNELASALGRNGDCTQIITPDATTRNAYNLKSGVYFLRVYAHENGHIPYAARVHAAPHVCGNKITETRAGEACDGGEYCNKDCSTRLEITSQVMKYPIPVAVRNLETVRIKIHMAEDGWVDIGTGDFERGCGAWGFVSLEDSDLKTMSVGEARGGYGGEACERRVARLSKGDYYAVINRGAFTHGQYSDPQYITYAAHTWGSCGDAIVNPLAGEVCDSVANCTNACQLAAGTQAASPWPISGAPALFSTADSTQSVFCSDDADPAVPNSYNEHEGDEMVGVLYDQHGYFRGKKTVHCSSSNGLRVDGNVAYVVARAQRCALTGDGTDEYQCDNTGDGYLMER